MRRGESTSLQKHRRGGIKPQLAHTGRGTHPLDLASICRVPAGLCIQETMAKWVDGGGGRSTALAFCLHRAEPGDCKKAAAGLSVHKFPFREVSPG